MMANKLLVITGTFVASSGTILTIIMCVAMNKNLFAVIFPRSVVEGGGADLSALMRWQRCSASGGAWEEGRSGRLQRAGTGLSPPSTLSSSLLQLHALARPIASQRLLRRCSRGASSS